MPDLENLTACGHWTANHDPHVRAAVELLIWHDYWLRRADFAKACVRTYGGESFIMWHQAREFAAGASRCSTSELNVLRLAVAIGSDEYGLSRMGDAHAAAIVRAFAAALGVTSLGGEAADD